MKHPAHILVVDDEAGVRHLIEMLLHKEGYVVETASHAAEALERFNNDTFDLIICDLMMPDMSGLEVLAEIKKRASEVEFILITAYGSMETAVEALRQGAHDYLIKPVNNDELKHSVNRALNYRRYKQEKQVLLESLQEHNKKLTFMLEASNRLAHLSPLPDLVLNEIIETSQRHLGLTVAVTTLDADEKQLVAAVPDRYQETWWAQILMSEQISEQKLHDLFDQAQRLSQSYLIPLEMLRTLDEHPALETSGPNTADFSILAIPLDARSRTRLRSVLWVIDTEADLSVENVQRLEIFANQISGALDNARLFTKQLNQLRVRNTLVNAGQRIATLLDHKEVTNTVLEAALRVMPYAELAVIYYKSKLDTELKATGLTQDGMPVFSPPIDDWLIDQALTDKQTIHKTNWSTNGDVAKKSLAIEPLTLTTVSLGLLAIISDHPDAFNEDHLQILTMLANQAAIALQNASLYAEAQRVDEIEALYEAGKAIDRTLNLQETITTTMAVSRSLTGASISSIYLYATGTNRIDSVVTLSDEVQITNADRRRAAKIARTIVDTQKPSLVIEPQGHRPLLDANGKTETQIIRSWLAVPLPSGDMPLGVLELGSENTDTFGSNDMRLMQIIASHAASAIQKARLYEELQQRLQQTEALNAISQSIITTLDLERVLELVVQSAAKTIPVATHSAIYLINQTEDAAPPDIQVITQGSVLPAGMAQVRQEAVENAIKQRTTIRTSHITEEQGHWSLLIAPLWVSEAINGAISVISPYPDAFHISDETLLNAFAGHASIAIQNAGLFKDLSTAYDDLSKKQKEILRSHSTLQALFNGITDGLYITDRQLRIVAINQAEANRIGSTPDALIGQPCDESHWKEATEAVTQLVLETFETGKEGIWESQSDVGSRGLFADRDVNTYPIFDFSGDVHQVIIFAQDVSEKRRLQASLFRSANMAAVGQLASSVAHQINNPLTVIIANSQIMEMDTDPDSPDYGIIKHIEEAGTHIRRIVQNLLDFSTQDSYDWFETNVKETIEDALILVSHSLRKSGIDVVKNINEMPSIIASASHLKLLWMNLFLNARDAIDACERDGIIKIIVSRLGPDDIQIQLIDNGIGIPEQHRDHLFHPFFTTKSSGKNLGLGLFTCDTIVEFHQGAIELDNNADGPGTVVRVTLPIDPTLQTASSGPRQKKSPPVTAS